MENGPYGSFTNQVFVNDGTGSFTPQVASFPTLQVDEDFLYTGDVDADGDLDVVVQSFEMGTYIRRVEVILNDNFIFTSNATLNSPYSSNPAAKILGLVDEDGDSDLDIIYSGRDASGNDALLAFENDGSGNFVDSGISNVLSTSLYYDLTEGAAALDFDNDGDFDIISALSGGYPNIEIRPFLNEDASNFTFTEQTTFTIPNNQYPDDLFVADFNGDGREEFMMITEVDSAILFQENGAGSFNRLAEFVGGGVPANLDLDADDDLFYLNAGGLSTLENQGSGVFIENAEILQVSVAYDSHLVDIDGDGDLDFAEISESNARIWLNDGSGNFTVGQEFGNLGYAAAFGDLDGDGDEDMVVGKEDETGFDIWSNTGGVLSYVSNFANGDDVEQVELADMDGDGDLDILVNNQYYDSMIFDDVSSITVYRNNGSLSFTEQSSYQAPDTYQFDVGDADGDGDFDVVVAEGAIGVLLNDGTGILSYGAAFTVSGSYEFYGVALADFDGDGDLDILASNAFNDSGTQSYIFFNDGTGLAGTYTGIGTGSTYRSFVSDIDGDGDVDFISGGYLAEPQLWANDGSGGFEFDSNIQAFTDEYSTITFGDLDGDGDTDLAISGYYTGSKVLFNDGTGVPENQEINIQGNGIDILAGDTTPSVDDGTDFGTVQVGEAKTSTFIIQNIGLADLGVTSITVSATDGMNDVSADFQVSGISLPTTVSGESFTSFSLTYTPENAAVIAGSVLVLNDDSDEFSYPFGITAIAEGSLPSPDSLALVALYNATDGANWTNNTNWLSGPLDTWFGVTATDGSVLEVTLPANNLTGTLPDEMEDLVSLSVLNFEFNNLSGPLPPEIGSLSDLDFINLRGNGFSGSIPPEFGDLGSLTVLDLGQNNLSETIPSELGSLINLGSLDVDENQLTGPIPSSFAGLINLNFLNIRSNNIDGLPDLTGLPLTDFDVSFNRIPDEDIALNASVITVNLGQNLSTPINEADSLALVSIFNATDGPNWTENTNWLENGQKVEDWFGVTVDGDRVTALDLNTNGLAGEVPSQISDLTSVQTLDLRFNTLTSSTILNDLQNLVEVRNILLSGNQFSGSIPDLTGLLNLQFLILDQNEFSGPLPASLGSITSLLALNLGDNLFEGTIPPELGNLENLLLLRIWSMPGITGTIPEELGNLSSLEEIDFGFLSLDGTIPTTFGDLSSLQILYLNDNNLTGALPQEITGLSNMTNISILNNAMDSIPVLTPLTALVDLRVQGNNLSFDDIEPNVGIPGFVYSPQNTLAPVSISVNQEPSFTAVDTVLRAQSEVVFSVNSGIAPNNEYVWSLDGAVLTGQTDSQLTIPSLSREDVGDYEVSITNTVATGLTINSDPAEILANAVISVQSLDEDTETPIGENVNAYLFPLGEDLGDTIQFEGESGILNVSSSFSFPAVLLDNYLLAVESVVPVSDGNGNQNPDATYVPTFFGDVFLSEEAEILSLTKDTTLLISMVEFPDEVDPGEGALSGSVEEDFPEDEARIETRRRAKRRKCGLRRRRTGGRQDDFELFAYGETNDQGEFEFGFLPEGTYRFFVEYPGVPLDPDAEVEFTVGAAGISDDTFTLEVFATPEGIEIEFILGIPSDFFADFNIYPNPTVDFISIEYTKTKTAEIKMEVLSLEGKVLISRSIPQGQRKMQINTSQLSPGQYLIRFSGNSGDDQLVYRMIKK